GLKARFSSTFHPFLTSTETKFTRKLIQIRSSLWAKGEILHCKNRILYRADETISFFFSLFLQIRLFLQASPFVVFLSNFDIFRLGRIIPSHVSG
ncbi:unnamed protein product, partial [Arabidopsis halleri]